MNQFVHHHSMPRTSATKQQQKSFLSVCNKISSFNPCHMLKKKVYREFTYNEMCAGSDATQCAGTMTCFSDITVPIHFDS